jgi:peptide/nickel transport system substrate-binding protein
MRRIQPSTERKEAKMKKLAVCLVMVFFVFLVTQVLAAERKLPADWDKREGGTLVWGSVSTPGTLDPHVGNANVTSRVIKRMFEGLLERDLTVPSTQGIPPIKPALAESWQVSTDGLTYTFHLRRGVKFHDGEPMNADAVVFSYRRWTDPSFEYFYPRANSMLHFVARYIKNVEKVDEYTVKINLKQPNANFAEMMVEPCGLGQSDIVSPKQVKELGNEGFGRHPCGTGPFKFVESIRGEKIILERNESYWRELPYLKRVIFVPILEPIGRVMALMTGEVDVAFEIPADSYPKLKELGYPMAEGPNVHVWYLSLNMQNEYTKNLKVRQAINMAINKKAMADQLLKGIATPASQIAGYGTPAYLPELDKMYPYDPEKAKQLLKEAGYPDGFELVFWIPVGGSGELEPVQMAEWIQSDLRKIGIKVKLETYEWLTYVLKWAEGMPPEVAIDQMSWGMLTDWWFNHPYRNFNTSHIEDPEIVGLLEKAEQTLDDNDRVKIYQTINRLDRERAYHVPIVNGRRVSALGKKVRGWIHTMDWAEQLRTVWKEK